jgi:hypothetical protein
MGDLLIVLAYLHWIRLHAGRLLGQLNHGAERPDAMPAWQAHCRQARVSLQ